MARKHGTALVTGAARGIGRAIAVGLATAGFDVAINDRAASADLDETAALIDGAGRIAAKVVGDVADLAAHPAILDAAEAGIGPLTTLVNNAGVSVMNRGDLLDVTVESYDRCQAVNTRAMFFLTQAFARRLLTRDRDDGRPYAIVNITSANAGAASLNRGEYAVSKAAAAMVSQVFAARLAGESIQVFDVRPGIIETEMTKPSMHIYRKRIEEENLTLIRRPGTPDDVARIVVTLATGGLPFTAGQVIAADAGLLLPRL